MHTLGDVFIFVGKLVETLIGAWRNQYGPREHGLGACKCHGYALAFAFEG